MYMINKSRTKKDLDQIKENVIAIIFEWKIKPATNPVHHISANQ